MNNELVHREKRDTGLPALIGAAGEPAAPTVKQHLAAIRMVFDWLVTGQVMRTNPAHSVRGPRHSLSKRSTPALSSEVASQLLTTMAGHSNAKTTGLYDRRSDDVSVSEVEQLRYLIELLHEEK